jgi:hypothetical protein
MYFVWPSVCVSVCLSVCLLPVLKTMVESVVGWSRVTVFISYHVRSSRISLSLVIDRFCAFFSLARSMIKCCDSLDSIVTLFVENTTLKPQFIFWSIVDFIAMGDLARSSVLAVCLHSWYRMKMHCGNVVFLQLPISNLSQNILFYCPSIGLEYGFEGLFVSWLLIWSQWVRSARIVCTVGQLRLYTAHTAWRVFSVMKQG